MRFWPKICFGLLKSCAVWLNYSGNWSQQSLQTVFFAPPPTSTMVTRWCKFPPSATLKIALLGLPKRRENVSPENNGAMSCLIRNGATALYCDLGRRRGKSVWETGSRRGVVKARENTFPTPNEVTFQFGIGALVPPLLVAAFFSFPGLCFRHSVV